ncbi:MAG TPA: hypothetical protein VIJ93_03690 [bacterium]
MRLRIHFSLIISLALPVVLWADAEKEVGETVSQQYNLNEAMVDKLDGTIMVQHPDGSKPTPMQTNSTVQKGDVLTVFDKSWVIFKNHKGDRIGLDSDTVVAIDEFYIQGPDRQVRLLLQKGSLFLKTNGCDSRQSFFEINAGSEVTSISDVQAIIQYDPAKEHLKVQYLNGKLSVVDKDAEQKFNVEHSEHTWDSGKMMEVDPAPVDDLDEVNFRRFLDAEPRLEPTDNNILLKGNS